MSNSNRNYRDILHEKRPPLPHNHPPMSHHDRAAQFAPFSPLTGHGSALDQTAQRHAQSLEPQYTPISEQGDLEEE